MTRLLGAVLAGGQSRRFGSDKALAELDDRPLIAHAVEAIEPHVEAVAICGREFGGYIALVDLPMPGLGPLGGLASALRYALDHGFDAVLSIGCDMPAFPNSVVTALVANEMPIAVSSSPICGLWPASYAELLIKHLVQTQNYSMNYWISVSNTKRLDVMKKIYNINTQIDMENMRVISKSNFNKKY